MINGLGVNLNKYEKSKEIVDQLIWCHGSGLIQRLNKIAKNKIQKSLNFKMQMKEY